MAEASTSIKPAYCFTDDEVEGDMEEYFRVGFGEIKMPLALEALGKFVDAEDNVKMKFVVS